MEKSTAFAILFLGSLVIVFGAIASIMYLIKSAQKVHVKLDIVEKEAKDANTEDELITAWENLKVVNKECWHRSFGTRVIKIKTILETKYQLLYGDKNKTSK